LGLDTFKQQKSTGSEQRRAKQFAGLGLASTTTSGAFNNVKKSAQPVFNLDKNENPRDNESENSGIPSKNKNSFTH
jgi:hypothetical protein